jgi:hypothetical protein
MILYLLWDQSVSVGLDDFDIKIKEVLSTIRDWLQLNILPAHERQAPMRLTPHSLAIKIFF